MSAHEQSFHDCVQRFLDNAAPTGTVRGPAGELIHYLSRLTGVNEEEIHVARVKDDKNLLERLGKVEHHEMCLFILRGDATVDKAIEAASENIWASKHGFRTILIALARDGTWQVEYIVGAEETGYLTDLTEHFGSEVVPVDPFDPEYLPSKERFHALVESLVESGRPWKELEKYLAQVWHLDESADHSIYVLKGASNNIVKLDQGHRRRRHHHQFGLYLLTSETDKLNSVVEVVRSRFVGAGVGKYDAVGIATKRDETWEISAVVEALTKSAILRRVFPDIRVDTVSSQVSDESEPNPQEQDAIVTVPLVVDDRVMRMVKLAISSSKAVMLVGPPGTAKTMLLTEVIREMREDPEVHGFSRGWDARWVTPEESWTTRDLLGGETVDENANLRFRPGYVLESILENQWLVLDEANRADMDRIFGGLLTWLSGKSVTLGRASTAVDAPAVELGWTEEPECRVENEEGLKVSGGGGDSTIRFIAGKEWRLLGTYNALDAQRVFRFGQALGRRFVRIPIPLATAGEFEEILAPLIDGLPEVVAEAIKGLYETHLESGNLALGPALFLWIPRYVRRGIESGATAGEVASAHDTSSEETGDPESAPGDGDPSAESALARQLVAEAYLSAAGAWLANAEDGDLDVLGQRIVERGILSGTDWEWLRGLLSAMR